MLKLLKHCQLSNKERVYKASYVIEKLIIIYFVFTSLVVSEFHAQVIKALSAIKQ